MAESVSNTTGRELNMGRDSSWLIGADIIAVFLASVSYTHLRAHETR